MKNKDYVLYLDLDGVLVDFSSGYRNLSEGINFDDYASRFNKDKGKQQYTSMDQFRADMARKKYLESGVDFWANLSWLKGGPELWEASADLYETVCILSSTGTVDPVRGAIVETGKRRWLKKNMPDMPEKNIFIVNGAHLKKTHSNPDSILVDDRSATIKDWKTRGGYGILHWWKQYLDTIEKLEALATPTMLSEIIKRFHNRYL